MFRRKCLHLFCHKLNGAVTNPYRCKRYLCNECGHAFDKLPAVEYFYYASQWWEYCTGCDQPNHSEGGLKLKTVEKDCNGGTAHATMKWMKDLA